MLLCIMGLVCGDPLPADNKLRSEIEEAARDSRQLADDLAGMLARLEEDVVDPLEEEAVDAALLEDNSDVEVALQEMIKRIGKLAETTEEQGRDNSGGSVTKEREEEEELHETLLELENVAKEIEFVAATTNKKSDTAAIESMAKILKEVSERIKGVEESAKIKKTSNKKPSVKKVFSLDDEEDDEDDTGDEQKKEENVEDLLADLIEGSTDSEEADEDTSSENNTEDDEDKSTEGVKEQKSRSGKQLDDELLDSLEEPEEPEEEETSKVEYKKEEVKEEEPKETCEDKPQSDRIQVCTPDFENKESSVQFYTQRPVQSQYCFNVTKTVCEERSQAVSKEVCTYEYQQKEVIAPAHLAEVGFERHLETFYITKCEKKLIKDEYKEKEVEVCYKEYVDVPYRIPTVSERIEDFIELSAPVPEKRCRLIKYDVPEVICKDTVNKECVTLQSLEKDTVQSRVSNIQQEYKGDCQSRDLEQTTTVCTIEQKVKLPSYPQYNSYRG